jgi:hypothetical protein
MLVKVGRASLLGKYGFAKGRDAMLCVYMVGTKPHKMLEKIAIGCPHGVDAKHCVSTGGDKIP